ncbi:unnamed protein product [Candida verbasci]|uniref:K Homology domain-containing protein n=1 Tax=Candida verbasci TaxID=1227364 RepID=A0A9W4XNQ0_9ASCO|nr:unnamed protein product [Candida verbasci]
MSDISSTETNNSLKRKLEEDEQELNINFNDGSSNSSSKRMALDSSQNKEEVKQEESSPATEEPTKKEVKFEEQEEPKKKKKGVKFQEEAEVVEEKPKKKGVSFQEPEDDEEEQEPKKKGVSFQEPENEEEEEEDGEEESEEEDKESKPTPIEQQLPPVGSDSEITFQPQQETYQESSHQVSHKDEITYRMYCPVKEASTIVGKKGETITHIRRKADVKVSVSENLPGVPERIVTVKGSIENVARAFGLIVRTILEEPEDEPATIDSQTYNLKLLIPHPMIGFIIGKQGSTFRKIEEESASKLKAAEQPLAFSTDRILSVQGVADAIHIALYYIALEILEHKDVLKKSNNKIILYNPANYQHNQQIPSSPSNPTAPISVTSNLASSSNPLPFQTTTPQQSQSQPFNVLPYGQAPGIPAALQQLQQQPATQPFNLANLFPQTQQPQQNPNPYMQQQPVQQQAPMGGMGMNQQPAVPSSIPQQNQYIDEYGNNMIGEVIVKPAVQIGNGKFNQDIFVANSSIGSVIGKGGNNIKHIRTNSGCSYVDIEPDMGQSIMVKGKGLTNIRKLTLTGTPESFNMAIYLINQRINADRERNAR